MKKHRPAIISGIICLTIGILIGGFIFTKIGMTYEYSGRAALLLSLRELVKTNQNEQAINLIENQIDANLQLFNSLKKSSFYGFYYFNPATISQASKNIKSVSFDIKSSYDTNSGKLSPESIDYLQSIKSRF